MEHLQFSFLGGQATTAAKPYALAGVVSSGNLEVMMEAADLSRQCEVHITTSAQGFEDTWQSVLESFQARHALADIRITINDAGATPAVVTLRLDQALHDLLGGRHG